MNLDLFTLPLIIANKNIPIKPRKTIFLPPVSNPAPSATTGGLDKATLKINAGRNFLYFV